MIQNPFFLFFSLFSSLFITLLESSLPALTAMMMCVYIYCCVTVLKVKDD